MIEPGIPAGAIPTLITERMVLRAPVVADFEAYGEILMSSRATAMGGPFDRRDTWLDFCMEVASWALRGYGPLAMEERKTERFLGLSIIHHDDGDPEPELGWVISEAAEGHGFAYEAASAHRAWAFEAITLPSLVSYIAPGNDRSVALAKRLGAEPDPSAVRPDGYPNCLVYRHAIPGGTHD